jgi:Domain of Unknown Function (DUF1206)
VKAAGTVHAGSSSRKGIAALAHFGLATRGFTYVVIGWLAFQIALGHKSHQANQRGALAEIAQKSAGLVLLWIVGIGFAAYALWRFVEAALGSPGEGRKAGPRLKAAARGVAYAALCVSTFAFIAGTSRQGQDQKQSTLTARVMRHDFGRWLVGAVGVAVLVVGVVMIIDGARKKFEEQLRTSAMSPSTRRLVGRVGMVGTIARGIVFAVAGVLVIDAAVSFDPHKSRGLDGALRTLAAQPYGPWMLGALAVGLMAFGLYGFAEARWVRT